MAQTQKMADQLHRSRTPGGTIMDPELGEVHPYAEGRAPPPSPHVQLPVGDPYAGDGLDRRNPPPPPRTPVPTTQLDPAMKTVKLQDNLVMKIFHMTLAVISCVCLGLSASNVIDDNIVRVVMACISMFTGGVGLGWFIPSEFSTTPDKMMESYYKRTKAMYRKEVKAEIGAFRTSIPQSYNV